MTRLLAFAPAFTLVLLLAQVSHATGPVWCHEVRPGDTLHAIARHHGVSVKELRGLNRLAPKAIPRPRQMLMLRTVHDLRRGSLDLSRPPLAATPRRLDRESAAAQRDRLSRMRDLTMVYRFRRAGLLVDLPPRTRTYYVQGVSPALRLTRPWSLEFIEHMAQVFHHLFDKPLRITSLTRTRSHQRALLRRNPSAAPAAGPVQSTHLTGAAVDISKLGLSEREVAWLRTVLARQRARGVIHVAEEFGEPHFHVLVRRAYASYTRALGSPILTGGC